MTLSEAIPLLLAGNKIRNTAWAKDKYIDIRHGSTMMNDQRSSWHRNPIKCDMEGDWEVVECK